MTTFKIITDFCDEEEEEDDGGYWTMKFVFTAGDLTYGFRVSKPYNQSKADWLVLADGKIGMDLYNDDRERSIYLCEDDGLEFTEALSGSGDVDSSVTIPRALVADKLRAVIEEADSLGCRFDEK